MPTAKGALSASLPFSQRRHEMIGTLIAKKKVSSAYGALNRRDIAAFIADWTDDCAFIFPGNLPISGTMKGRAAVETWFQNFLKQFPKARFTVKDICAKNTFDLVGTNVITSHWVLDLTNRDGKEVQNSGVTVINLRLGKAFLVKDYLFDPDTTLRTAWGMEDK